MLLKSCARVFSTLKAAVVPWDQNPDRYGGLQGEFDDVKIKRISTAEVADIRKMFDNFTYLRDKCKKHRDDEAVAYVSQTMDLWEHQLILQNTRNHTSLDNFTALQQVTSRWTTELADLLDLLHALATQSAHDHLQRTPSTIFSSQTQNPKRDEPVTQFSTRGRIPSSESLSSTRFATRGRNPSNGSTGSGKYTDEHLIETCESLCTLLDDNLTTNIATGTDKADSKQRSTLGFRYNCATMVLEGVEVGLPAYNR